MNPERIRENPLIWAGFLLLILGFATDLHFDIRERDVFSWMDPYQYYDFALGVVEGRERFDGFEIPSIFPFFVMPLLIFAPSVPGSLWISLASMIVLLIGIYQLCRELEIQTPSLLVAALVLSSPILTGLSRTLYVEFTLTALASIVFVFWLRFVRRMDARSGAAFGAALGLAYMTKTTFPVFIAASVAGAVVARLAERRPGAAARLVAASAGPIVLAVVIHVGVFSQAIGYYINLVSTTLPFMYLMGPAEPASWASATYYFGELGRSLLFLLTPLLGIACVVLARRMKGLSWADLGGPRAALWLWLIGPLVLLIAHPLKEPRHVAPCVIPAVLLLVIGIEAIPKRALRNGLMACAIGLALLQYGLVTVMRMESLYFLDRPLHLEAIRAHMMEAAPRGLPPSAPPRLRELHWKYGQNVALAGFPANEALALTWQSFPGVAFDLRTFDDPGRMSDRIPYERFEDLYFLAGINTYNRRCGWHAYYESLDREAVVAHADFLILNDIEESEASSRFPNHAPVATIHRPGGTIRILRAQRETTSYRVVYARRFLERHPALPESELRTVAEELLIAAVLRGERGRARGLANEFPVLGRTDLVARNIYWIGGYPALLDLTRRRITHWQAEQGHRE